MPKLYATKLDEAREWNARGVRIVTCSDKVPTKKEWKSGMGLDEIEESLKGNADLGIAAIWTDTDYVDVEYDSAEGEAALTKMCGGEPPPTPTFRSARGLHRIYRLDKNAKPPRAKADIEGVECRVGGGGKSANSVVPNSGGRVWLPGLSPSAVEFADLPAAIVARLCMTTKHRPQDVAACTEVICEPGRNNELYKKGRALKEMGLPEAVIAETLRAINAALCQPPLEEQEVRDIAKSAASGEAPKIGFLARLLAEMEFWHDENGEPYATVPQGDHRENWKIGKRYKAFRRWLSKRFYDETGSMLSDKELSDLCSLIEGKAVFEGRQYRIWRRVAEHEGIIYIDLCNEAWEAIEIDAEGWRLVPNPPVKFARAKAMSALPMPESTKKGETLRSLLEPFLNIEPSQWPLAAGWLVGALRPRGPYPILRLSGEQGSAKTTTARVFRQLVDPNQAPVRAEPRSTRDLMIAANNGRVLCLDNLSVVKGDLSDALCRISTGGGFSTRTLYTDEDETIFDVMLPLILTSIEEIATRSDLVERSLILALPTIDESKRRAEKEFWRAFDDAHPRILGALFDALSRAIVELPAVEQRQRAELSRMADFEQWATAAEAALGLAPGEFAEAYAANRQDAQHIALESSPVVTALLAYVKSEDFRKVVAEADGSFAASATDLLRKLALGANCEMPRQPGWPKTARVLSANLRRVAPNLRAIGISVTLAKVGNEKLWHIDASEYASAHRSQKTAPVLPPAPETQFAKSVRAQGVIRA